MDKFVQVERASLDALIKEVSDLNKSLRDSKLEALYTEVLDGNEAAKYLKVTKQYLQGLRDKREIKFYQSGFLVRYRKADLDKWLNSYQVGH